MMTTKMQWRAWMLWGCIALCGVYFCPAQQDPLSILVESGRIVVPVAWVGPVTTDGGASGWGGNCPRFSDECWWDGQRGRVVNIMDDKPATPFSLGILSPNKFHLFEDGNELPIKSLHEVAKQDVEVWLDNLGAHKEQAFGPRGIWSTLDLTPESIKSVESCHFFLITYAPPASPEGSCHTVRIKAPHESKLEYSKDYCNRPPPASDPLQGTPEGARLEAYLTAGRPGNFHPTAQADAFYGSQGRARVDVDIELPFKEVEPKSWHDGTLPTALLIVAYEKDGRVAGRLSEQLPEDPMFASLTALEKLNEAAVTVTSVRYEGQMDLPPGEYRLAIASSRGKEFGIAQVPLTVDNRDGGQFAISSIALCKRVRKTGAVPAARDFVPLVAGDYEFTPAGDTVFRKGEPLMAYFELYEPALAQPQPTLHVDYTMRIRNVQTGAVALERLQHADSWILAGKSTIPIAVEPVLSKLNLAPGKYQFQIQATDSAGRSTPTRAAEFSIV